MERPQAMGEAVMGKAVFTDLTLRVVTKDGIYSRHSLIQVDSQKTIDFPLLEKIFNGGVRETSPHVVQNGHGNFFVVQDIRDEDLKPEEGLWKSFIQMVLHPLTPDPEPLFYELDLEKRSARPISEFNPTVQMVGIAQDPGYY